MKYLYYCGTEGVLMRHGVVEYLWRSTRILSNFQPFLASSHMHKTSNKITHPTSAALLHHMHANYKIQPWSTSTPHPTSFPHGLLQPLQLLLRLPQLDGAATAGPRRARGGRPDRHEPGGAGAPKGQVHQAFQGVLGKAGRHGEAGRAVPPVPTMVLRLRDRLHVGRRVPALALHPAHLLRLRVRARRVPPRREAGQPRRALGEAARNDQRSAVQDCQGGGPVFYKDCFFTGTHYILMSILG